METSPLSTLTVIADVSGTVARIVVSAGSAVASDEPVIVIESMKMEIPVPAPLDGIVVELLVAEGEAVDEGQPVARLRAAGA